MLSHIIIFVTLFIIEIAYIKIARSKNIKDNPNHRSAHSVPTIRGGGIIILFSIILYAIFYQTDETFLCFFTGIVLVSIVSFIDDLITLSSKLRIAVHLIAFSLLFYGLDLIQFNSFISVVIILFAYIFSLGFLNIYNFMDGINGITFLNALITFATFLYINEFHIPFVNSNLLIVLIMAMVVFGFFNFRTKAVCFAGDIGSISIGFSILFLVIKLYLESENPMVFLILSVYLIDGGWTIFERILRKENIFEAHKRHLYQIMANDFKISHLKVSTGYFLSQLMINMTLIMCLSYEINAILVLGLVFAMFSIVYLLVKIKSIEKLKK